MCPRAHWDTNFCEKTFVNVPAVVQRLVQSAAFVVLSNRVRLEREQLSLVDPACHHIGQNTVGSMRRLSKSRDRSTYEKNHLNSI